MNQCAIELAMKKCKSHGADVAPLGSAEIERLLCQLSGWRHENGIITKSYTFKDHYQTMAFVNAIAWISHREDHHPDLHVGYNRCRVDYQTHTINGLSENDFICAAKVDALCAL